MVFMSLTGELILLERNPTMYGPGWYYTLHDDTITMIYNSNKQFLLWLESNCYEYIGAL